MAIAFLAGAAIFAVAGILFAPDKGSKTRRKLERKAKKIGAEVKGSVNENVKDLKEYITDFIDDVKTSFSDLEEEVKERVSAVEKKVTSETKVKV